MARRRAGPRTWHRRRIPSRSPLLAPLRWRARRPVRTGLRQHAHPPVGDPRRAAEAAPAHDGLGLRDRRRPRSRRSCCRLCEHAGTNDGYPDGISGEQIPLIARIVCCCDAYNAMTSDRSYRKALPVSEAVAEIRRVGRSSTRASSTRCSRSSSAKHWPPRFLAGFGAWFLRRR
ncbi:MAG: HD domain-containing phosphohydrolase [Actinomycetota bacterium]